MNSLYYCFLWDAEFNTSKEWNAHLKVTFFLFFSINLIFFYLFNFFKINVHIFCIDFFFILFSYIFISIELLNNFLIWYVWTCSKYIYIWSSVFEDMFKISLKLSISTMIQKLSFTQTSLFFLPQLDVSIVLQIFAQTIIEDFFLFNSSQQQLVATTL